jgi:ribosomal protein S18 acetylase RimI-like enzyme
VSGSLDVVRLERPTPARLEELARYDEEAFGSTGLRSYDLGVVARAGGLYVGLVDGRVAACCQVVRMMDEPSMFWILGFYVRPSYRGQGLGRDLLATMAEEIRAHGGIGLVLTTGPDNRAALGLYLGFGFRIVDEVPDFYGPGEDRYVLRWESGGTPGVVDEQ